MTVVSMAVLYWSFLAVDIDEEVAQQLDSGNCTALAHNSWLLRSRSIHRKLQTV